MKKQNKLEYIGLAKNEIDVFEPLKSILNVIGKKVLSAEELAIYREKEKEKEAIITKATKNKKKITEDMYPYLDPLVPMNDGSIDTYYFFICFFIFFLWGYLSVCF